jgi:hypothetical protein
MGTHAEAERRQFGRRQTCLHGMIVARGRPREPCVMRNISSGGALLEVGRPFLLPHRFRLHIEVNGLDVECEIAHRDENVVGVRFIGAPAVIAAQPLTA